MPALVALSLAQGASADGCETADATGVLFHGCRGTATARMLLLPDSLPLPPLAPRAVLVSGGYTGTDTRDDGAPAPVGLTVLDGTAVGQTLARMDGILILGPGDAAPRLVHRARAALDGRRYDLRDVDERRAFLAAARAGGVSVLQSHLLVVDGRVDTRPVDGAPVATRRVFFTKGAGFGVWESARPLTLDAAARALARDVAPDMALNLDMGSYDVCLRGAAAGPEPCGFNQAGWQQRQTTLLLLQPR
ncbi:MAG: hypothetical protein AAF677_01625 [Pseudomonadota bacterium]